MVMPVGICWRHNSCPAAMEGFCFMDQEEGDLGHRLGHLTVLPKVSHLGPLI